MVPGANSEAAPSSMEIEYLSVAPSTRIRRAVKNGTTDSMMRCRQVNRGSESSVEAAGVVLTRLFHHILHFHSGQRRSDLKVVVDPALDLKPAIIGDIEADAVRVLILTRPAHRGLYFYIPPAQGAWQ